VLELFYEEANHRQTTIVNIFDTRIERKLRKKPNISFQTRITSDFERCRLVRMTFRPW